MEPQQPPQPFPALRFAAAQMRKNAEQEGEEIRKYADYIAGYLEWMAEQTGDVMTFDPVFAYGVGQLALKANERGIVARLLPEWDKLQEAYPLTAPPAAVRNAGERIAKAGVTAPPPTFGSDPAPSTSPPAPSPAPSFTAAAATRSCPALGEACAKGCAPGTRCAELVTPAELNQVRGERDTLFRTLAARPDVAALAPTPPAPPAKPRSTKDRKKKPGESAAVS